MKRAGALIRVHGPPLNFDGDGKEFLTLDHSYAMTDAEGRWSCSEIPKELRNGGVGIEVLHPGFSKKAFEGLTPDQVGGAEISTRLPEDFE